MKELGVVMVSPGGSDDIEWVGLGLINAYKFTNNKVFLDMDY